MNASLKANLVLLIGAYAIAVLMTLLAGIKISQFSLSWWIALISPLSRSFDFIIGTAAGLIYLRNKNFIGRSTTTSSVVEFSAIIIFVAFYLWHHNFATKYIWNNSIYFNLVITAFIYVFSFQSGVISKILSFSPLVYLGEVSFSLYMIHQLMIRYCERYIGSIVFHADSIEGVLKQILFFMAIIAASILIYEAIEKPLRNRIRNSFK
jgi:peptidoglycan/LPS O-acetylase OafA/YrhL